MGKKKQPKNKISASPPQKTPKSINVEQTINGTHLTWRFSSADRTHGEWGWQNLSGNDLERLMDCLQQFETMTFDAILRGGSHPISIEKLSEKAKVRLVELKKDDWDEVFSFRIMSKPRAFFLRQGSLMRALWWDPNHTVFPSKKK